MLSIFFPVESESVYIGETSRLFEISLKKYTCSGALTNGNIHSKIIPLSSNEAHPTVCERQYFKTGCNNYHGRLLVEE